MGSYQYSRSDFETGSQVAILFKYGNKVHRTYVCKHGLSSAVLTLTFRQCLHILLVRLCLFALRFFRFNWLHREHGYRVCALHWIKPYVISDCSLFHFFCWFFENSMPNDDENQPTKEAKDINQTAIVNRTVQQMTHGFVTLFEKELDQVQYSLKEAL